MDALNSTGGINPSGGNLSHNTEGESKGEPIRNKNHVPDYSIQNIYCPSLKIYIHTNLMIWKHTYSKK